MPTCSAKYEKPFPTAAPNWARVKKEYIRVRLLPARVKRLHRCASPSYRLKSMGLTVFLSLRRTLRFWIKMPIKSEASLKMSVREAASFWNAIQTYPPRKNEI